MSPIEISAHINKQTDTIAAGPKATAAAPQVEQEQQQAEVQNIKQQEEDLNNNRDSYQQQQQQRARSRSCSSAASGPSARGQTAEEGAKRRSERLQKKYSTGGSNLSLEFSSSSCKNLRSQSKMLSKIKALASSADSRGPSSFNQSLNNNNNNNSDTEDNNNDLDNDSNNNNLVETTTDTTTNPSNNNNNNNNSITKSSASKMSQEELMDIVEVSRKRRLSRGSADQLGSFIRWSFSHVEHLRERRASFTLFQKQNSIVIENNNNNNDDDDDEVVVELLNNDERDNTNEDEDNWTTSSSVSPRAKLLSSASSAHLSTEQLLRHHAKMAANSAAAHAAAMASQCGGSSAANLALLRHQQLTAGGVKQERLIKRPRTHLYSPDVAKPFNLETAKSGPRKVSSYLGNVVDRLHQQQQQQALQLQQQQQQQQQQEQEAANGPQDQESSSSGLSFHLQQFLSQQTSLEDLCSSVGLDDSNQLVLAAAIHRALVDSVGPGGGGASGGGGQQTESSPTKSSSSTGSSSSSSAMSSNNTHNLHNHHQSSGANLHLVDSLNSVRASRRAYNTRGSSSLSSSSNGVTSTQPPPPSAAAAAAAATRRDNGQANSTAATLAALNINSRVQQQRHAQAAAALSALANAGAHHHHHHHHHQQQQHQQHNHSHHSHGSPMPSGGAGGHQLVSNSLQVAASGVSSAVAGATPVGTGNPMVDFECETCGSSFDDRHRLMQHQSIHLELKKDWFTETPVDEVMKIFNRRRGEFLCNSCNLRFEATFDYDKHNHQVHGQRPYCCQFCGNGTRTFRFWRQYLNHLYDHRYIFSCTIDDCDFTVNRRDSLRFHIFRFHLNCQLPQQQTHIRSAGHQTAHNMLMGGAGSVDMMGKWPNNMSLAGGGDLSSAEVDDDLDQDLDQDTEMNMGE